MEIVRKCRMLFGALLVSAIILICSPIMSFALTITGSNANCDFELQEDFESYDESYDIPKTTDKGWFDNDSYVSKAGYAVIEGGKLKIHASPADASSGSVSLKFGETLKNGIVKVGFTIRFVGGADENTQSRFFLSGTGPFIARSSGKMYGKNALETVITDEQDFEVECWFDAETAKPLYCYINGVEVGVTDRDYSDISSLKFMHFSNRLSATKDVDLYVDNIYVKQCKKPKIVSTTVTDGMVGAEINAPEFQFNTPISEETINEISLTKNGEKVEDASFILSEGGTKVRLSAPLEYSSLYILKISDNLKSIDGIAADPVEYSFHTKHKPAALTKTGNASFDKVSLNAGETVTVSANFSNSTIKAEDVVVILAIYSPENIMESVKLEKFSINPGSVDAPVSANITLPDDVSGKTLRAYFWNGFDCTEIITDSVSIN